MSDSFDVVDTNANSKPAYSLHSVRGIVWAAFWGSVLAGGIVMAINYIRLGRTAAAWMTLGGFLAAMIVVMAISFSVPMDVEIPFAFYLAPQLVATYFVAKRAQGELIETHCAIGGNVVSTWRSVGVGLICLPFVLGGVVAYAFLTDPLMGDPIPFGNNEIYIRGEATEQDAGRLAAALTEVGFFDEQGATVILESTSGHQTIGFVVETGAWNEAEVIDAYRDIALYLIDVEYAAPLTIQLYNEYLEPRKTFTVDAAVE